MTRTCERCGESFTPIGKRSYYCSAFCRFVAKIDFQIDGCWLWGDSLATGGYGAILIDGTRVYAHRWAYEHLGKRTLLPGLVIDHLCRNKACVNPDYLEQVTSWENTLRGVNPNIQTHLTGVCKRGHSMADAIIKPNGRRRCRPCHNSNRR